MRTEEFEKAHPLYVQIGQLSYSLPSFNTSDEEEIKVLQEAQYRKAETDIREYQKTSNEHGYVIMQGIVYKFHIGTTKVTKITGVDAKPIKRAFKRLIEVANDYAKKTGKTRPVSQELETGS